MRHRLYPKLPEGTLHWGCAGRSIAGHRHGAVISSPVLIELDRWTFFEQGLLFMKPNIAEDIRAKTYDVFISYKREDDAARAVLAAALEREGFDPWWDAKLGQGDFRNQLRDEINRCDVVIALWSQNAHAKPDEVKMEMAHAFGVKKLLPLKLDGAPIPAQFAKENFLPFDG
jgi:TIR domain